MSTGLIVLAVVIIAIIGLVLALVMRRPGLRLRQLSEEERLRYADQWRVIEARFIDQPREAVGDADRLAVALLAERGAQMDDRHAPEDLKKARRLAADGNSSEGMRRAMVAYQAVIDDAVGRQTRERVEAGRREIA